MNASIELTNLPLSLYTSAQDFDSLTQPPTFISNCAICDESFSTQQESDAHFASEDHETAQVTNGYKTNLNDTHQEIISDHDTYMT